MIFVPKLHISQLIYNAYFLHNCLNVSHLFLVGLYPALAAALGPKTRVKPSPSMRKLVPLNLFMLATAKPGSGKSNAFQPSVISPMALIQQELGGPFMVHVSILIYLVNYCQIIKATGRTKFVLWPGSEK